MATPYKLTVEQLTKTNQGFTNAIVLIDDYLIELDYVMGTQVDIAFAGFTLNLHPFRAQNAETLSLEYNLYNPGHPLHDDTIGVARGTVTISTGNEIFTYFNFYVNIGLEAKLRIRLNHAP